MASLNGNAHKPQNMSAQQIDTNDSDALEALAAKVGISREELLNVITITGTRVADVEDYVKNEGSPGTTP
jgi:uncharacterized protein YidB (DUF937 family)